jgi:hypothetical protein
MGTTECGEFSTMPPVITGKQLREKFMFTWNYRIVNTKSKNAGEDWYCLQEVCYDKKGKPTGYGAPCMGSEDMKSLKSVFKMMNEAMKLPPLQEKDFK